MDGEFSIHWRNSLLKFIRKDFNRINEGLQNTFSGAGGREIPE